MSETHSLHDHGHFNLLHLHLSCLWIKLHLLEMQRFLENFGGVFFSTIYVYGFIRRPNMCTITSVLQVNFRQMFIRHFRTKMTSPINTIHPLAIIIDSLDSLYLLDLYFSNFKDYMSHY